MGVVWPNWWSDFMDSLCQFHMVAHKRGAAAMGGDKRERESRGRETETDNSCQKLEIIKAKKARFL